MAKDFKTAFSDSIDNFKQYIKPILEKEFGGEFLSVEDNKDNSISDLLDRMAGIDILHVHPIYGLRGIAGRIQKGNNWRTFTVRAYRDSGAKTEYEKRTMAIENDWLYPYFTYQAYITPNSIHIGVAKTKDIFDCIKKKTYNTKKTGVEQKGQAVFYVIDWDDMIKNGYKIFELNEKIIKEDEKDELY